MQTQPAGTARGEGEGGHGQHDELQHDAHRGQEGAAGDSLSHRSAVLWVAGEADTPAVLENHQCL